MIIAVCGQQRFDVLLHIAARIIIRQGRRIAMKQRVRLQRQVIARQMLGRKRQRNLHILQGFIQGLIRQRIHQIEIEIIELLLRNLDGTTASSANEYVPTLADGHR